MGYWASQDLYRSTLRNNINHSPYPRERLHNPRRSEFGNGKNLMQPVLAQDLAEAYFNVLSNRQITMNREYNLLGKEPISYIDLVRTVSRALGKSNVMVPVEEYLLSKRSPF